MAKTLGGIEALKSTSPATSSLRAVWTLRLATGFVALLGATLFFLGTSWDIQWHTYIGRDRTLIPPHIVMLIGVTISGLAALAAVLIETLWARRGSSDVSTDFAGAFRGSLGAYIAGFGALGAAVAFPLDSYWHALYGIDVAIWAPFHVMIITGMALAALGALYMLLSAAHLSERQQARGATRAARIGVVVALAITMCIFTYLLFDAYGDMGMISLGTITINVFCMLAALLGTWTFVAATYALSWRWAATVVALVSLLFVLIVALYVPPVTDWLVQAEHLAYRRAGAHLAAVAFEWPATFIVAAVIIDSLMRRARKKEWSRGKQALIIGAAALVGFLPIPIIFPIYPLELAQGLGIAGFVISLLLGLLGGYVGAWLGRNTGESMYALER